MDEELRAENEMLRKALKPFAAIPIKPEYPDDQSVLDFMSEDGQRLFQFTCGDFRQARAAIAAWAQGSDLQ